MMQELMGKALQGPVEEVAKMEAQEAENLLQHLGIPAWEGRAYDYCMENLRNVGFPVDGLAFDPDLVIRGLVIDKEKGNLVKADRFGYIKRVMHGTRMLSTREVRYGLGFCVYLSAQNIDP
ncbi:hypothetical protein T459_35457 [Capsicum annuum]|uniref:Uncharacterized protein n=1 Tax=Capsicum annuum TaxID=4072 RepID=A0A2G2XJ93_CAPAN|nr:hypothetical protein T459_35457 [Capsicum annuum]